MTVKPSPLSALQAKPKARKRRAPVPKSIPSGYTDLYRAIVDHLEDAGRYQAQVDRQLVENYVLTQRQIDQARQALENDGMFTESGTGVRAHPAIAAVNQSTATLVRIASALGIGPAARKSLSLDSAHGQGGRKPGSLNGGSNPWV